MADPMPQTVVTPAGGPWRRAERLGLSLRAESDADRLFTTVLYASTREEELSVVAWTDAQKTAFLAAQHDAQHEHYRRHYAGAAWLIVEREGRAIGRLYLDHWSRETRIIDIALMPEARGGGIGTALLGDIVDEAEAAGRIVSIHVERMNPALSLYRRLGFEVAEDKGVYLLMERSGAATEGAGVA